MQDTHTIQNNLSYLQGRFNSDRINVNWKDRKAFSILIDYIEELEVADYKVYLERLTTYILVHNLIHSINGNGLTEMDIKTSLRNIESIYRIDKKEWHRNFASECWPVNIDSNYEDYKELISTLVSDVIRYNAKKDEISAI